MNKIRSDFLFSTPTFASGAARALDLFGTYDTYNSSSTDHEADFSALFSDWSIVGQDISFAMSQLERSLPPESVSRYNELCEAGQQSLFP